MNITNSKVLSNLSDLPLDISVNTETPKVSSNFSNYSIGLLFMFLNKIRHEVKGYTSARGFKFEDMGRVIKYDFRIIKRWMDYLDQYEKGASSMHEKNVLELGPGADLGIGLITLAQGAKSYNAVDVHNLIKGTPEEFYEQLFNTLQNDPHLSTSVEELQKQLKLTLNNNNDRLNYQVQKDFDISVLTNKNIDLIVSNAAFQQFDNPEKTIEQLSQISNPGAYFVALIDLKTHTRWINQRDPLNIYRYPNAVYNTLKFKGSQNRVRPNEFKQMLEKNNWKNVKIFSRLDLDSKYLSTVNQSLHPRFRNPETQMESLTCVICARKA